MEENKNLTPEVEETPETAEKKDKKLKIKKAKKEKAPKRIKNQALLRKGGFSVAITAAVLAGIIILNVLVSALSDRFVLEFDMTPEKINSMSDENIDYLKKLDTEVELIVCATEADYTGGYMSYYAQNLYGITEDATKYFEQTIKLLDKYPAYNDKIKLRFIDTQGTEFTEISTKYSASNLAYGDIIVSASKNGNERHKIVGFKDIYSLNEDSTYAAYGYTTSTVAGNNVETAVTSAIAYVTSSQTKKLALLTGHSKADYTADYQTLLKTNNYEVTVISDTIISSVSNEYDAIIIAAPNTDFIESELNALDAFLDNDGKLGKGLVFFADASAPYLKNLYEFLEQWGISVGEGILFETNTQNFMPDDPTTMGSYPASADEALTSGMQLCITGLNVPITAAFETEGLIKTTVLTATPESVVAAPVGTASDWTGADSYKKQSFATAIKAEKADYDDDNNAISSFVFAFSSVNFLQSQYNEQASVANKNLTLTAAEAAVGAEDTGISFISKTITNESFADKVTAASSNVMMIIFMILMPIISIVIGVYIFFRRKNA